MLQEIAWRLRLPYIDWVGSLAEANDSLEWWASAVAARNSYTMLFSRVCALALARQLFIEPQTASTLVVCSTSALVDEVLALPGAQPWLGAKHSPRRPSGISGRAYRAWSRFAPAPLLDFPGNVSDSARVVLDSDPRFRLRVLAESQLSKPEPLEGEKTALLFSWVDRRSFLDDGSYRDTSFGALSDWLAARGFRVAHVPQILHSIPFSEAVGQLASVEESFYLPDLYLSVDERRDAQLRATSARFSIPAASTVEDVPVQRLALELLSQEQSSLAGALTYEPLIRNLAAGGIRPSRIFHPYEGHSWELALIWSVRKHLPDTKVIGFENMNMSRLALSMYPAQSEYGRRPLPDVIVTNGPAFSRVLIEEGLPESLVRVGCAVRHADVVPDEPSARSDRDPDNPIRILASTDGVFGQAIELVQKAASAFGGLGRYEVVVKPHPLLDANAVKELMQEAREHQNIRFSDNTITELLLTADVLLYAYTIVCYEALAHGVPPVFVQSETVIDMDQLEPFRELRWDARTPAELRIAVDEIEGLRGASLAEWRESAYAAARAALAPVGPGCVDAFLA